MMKLSSFAVIEVASIMMLSSQDAKFSSWAVVKLTAVVVVAVELTAIMVAVTQVAAMVVAATQVTDVVVAMTQVAVVVVVSLPHQTQCPTCAIGCDSQRSFQVSFHHSLQGIPACFYGGQVLPCPHVL
jgi:hypothetical protein